MDNEQNLNKTSTYRHIIFILLILVLGVFVYNKNLRLNHLPMLDASTHYFPRAVILKESISDYHDLLPLWNPYIMSGIPFFADHVTLSIDSLTGIMIYLLQNPSAALNLSFLLATLIAGLFMYWLVFYLTKSHEGAFISAVIFTIGGYTRMQMKAPGGTTLNALFFMPIIFLVIVKAIKSKKWFFYSVIAGILYGLILRAGPDVKVSSWFTFSVGFLLLLHVFGKDFKNRFIKVILIGSIISIVMLGVGMQKILPALEYLKTTSKVNLGFDRAKSEYTPLKDVLKSLIQPINIGLFEWKNQFISQHIGIIAFLLACYGVYANKKNRIVISLVLTCILAILILNGPFFYYVIWKYVPFFKTFRHFFRAGIIFSFGASVLAGYGTAALFDRIAIIKSNKLGKITAIGIITILLILNLHIFNFSPVYKDTQDIYYNIARNYVAQNMSKMQGIFRYHDFESLGIDWGTEFSYIPLKIGNIFGYVSGWQPEYLNEYLSMANQQPAKFWGILNMKYLTSTRELNISGFKFVNKYEKCDDCYTSSDIQKVFGPYLYENEEFLPRAYFIKNSILVVGREEVKKQIIYSLMLDSRFKPANNIIITGKERINDYSIEELKKYSVVFLTQNSIDQNSGFLLKSYVDSGGILMPNIISGKNAITEEDIAVMFNSFNRTLSQVSDMDYIVHNFDKYEVRLDNKYTGFLVVSEKFSVFNGWTAKADGANLELLKADATITAVYLDKPVNSVVFEYKPKSYVIGRNVSILAFVLLLAYFGFFVYKANFPKGN